MAPQVVVRLPTRQSVIALTFDACQTKKPAGYDARIIRLLRQTRTPATLLLGGRWMEAHPQATRDLARDALFEIGNHSYLHPHMTRITEKRMREEIQKTQNILYLLTGKQGALFRPPFGEYDATLVKVAGQLGLKTLMWSVETGDPDRRETATALIRTVLSKAKPGAIVIMHMNGRGWHSAEALPTILRTLRGRGYAFVKVSDALRAASRQPPR